MQENNPSETLASIKPVTVAVAAFLNAFQPGPFCLRTFADQGAGGGRNYTVADFAAVAEALHAVNHAQNRGIFFVVNRGGHKDEDITWVTAHFVEADDGSLAQQYQNLMAFPLAPSIIVKTRKSLHGYWLMTPDDSGRSLIAPTGAMTECETNTLSNFKAVQQALAAHFGGDPVISNLSRVMRLPGFDHRKKEPVPVTCLLFEPERRYTQAQLMACLDVAASETVGEEASAPRQASDDQATRVSASPESYESQLILKACDFIRHCEANAATLSEPLWYAMITNLVNTADGEALIHALSRPHPRYDQAQTDAKISQARDSQAGPFSCGTIGDWGFVCPKQGRCPGKCPRSLGTRPLPPWYVKHARGLRFMPGVLANMLAREKNIIYAGAAYYQFIAGVYKTVDDNHIKRLIRKQLREDHVRLTQIKDVQGQFTMEISRSVEKLNPQPRIINLKNGLFDVKTQCLSPHDPGYLSTIQMGTSYDPRATAPLFTRFLADCLDEESRVLVQEIFGYLLIPETCAQKAFVLVGEGGAGKSTLLAVAQDLLLGRKNVSNVPWQSLNDRFKTAELFGKLANIFADLPSKNIDDNGLFKSITGEDMITAERKNKDPFAFKATARLVFSCNEIPRNLGDRSEAFYRRLVIVPFLPAKPAEHRDLKLKEKFLAEAPGIFNWALAGLLRLQARDYRFSQSPSSIAALDHYRVGGSSVLSFVEELCVVEKEAQAASTQLYHAYQRYCQDGGLKAVSQKRFGPELETEHKGVVRCREPLSRRMIYQGIGLDLDEAGKDLN